MARTPQDPKLNELSKKLADVEFDQPSWFKSQFQTRFNAGEKFKHCFFSTFCHRFEVRFSLGGVQRIVGICLVGWKAARFADMARLFFCKYRGEDEPATGEFNFGLGSAKHDLEQNVFARGILVDIENHLIASGLLEPVSAVINTSKDSRRLAARAKRDALAGIRKLADSMSDMRKILLANFPNRFAVAGQIDEEWAAFRKVLQSLIDGMDEVSSAANTATRKGVLEDLEQRERDAQELERHIVLTQKHLETRRDELPVERQLQMPPAPKPAATDLDGLFSMESVNALVDSLTPNTPNITKV